MNTSLFFFFYELHYWSDSWFIEDGLPNLGWVIDCDLQVWWTFWALEFRFMGGVLVRFKCDLMQPRIIWESLWGLCQLLIEVGRLTLTVGGIIPWAGVLSCVRMKKASWAQASKQAAQLYLFLSALDCRCDVTSYFEFLPQLPLSDQLLPGIVLQINI